MELCELNNILKRCLENRKQKVAIGDKNIIEVGVPHCKGENWCEIKKNANCKIRNIVNWK